MSKKEREASERGRCRRRGTGMRPTHQQRESRSKLPSNKRGEANPTRAAIAPQAGRQTAHSLQRGAGVAQVQRQRRDAPQDERVAAAGHLAAAAAQRGLQQPGQLAAAVVVGLPALSQLLDDRALQQAGRQGRQAGQVGRAGQDRRQGRRQGPFLSRSMGGVDGGGLM